jgi:choline kinase
MEEIAIVAGGLGIRLEEIHESIPKTLLRIGETTILDRIVDTISTVLGGRFRLFIAAGIYFRMLDEYVSSREGVYSKVQVLEARNWREGNAATLLALDGVVTNEEFILQMSDHLFSPRTYAKCISSDAVEAPHVCGQLRSDGLREYLDIEDATKILSDDENRIVEIGKGIPDWNMIDMGVFRLNQGAFGIISSLPRGQKSLSNYVKAWSKEKAFRVNPIRDAVWKDIDTPVDLKWASVLDAEGAWLP